MAITLRRDKGLPLTHDEMDDNFEELDKLPNGKIYPNAANIGVKIDTTDPDWAWELMPGRVIIDPSDPSSATVAIFKGGIRVAQFDEGDCANANFTIPQDYAPGTDLFIRVNWSHISDQVVSGSVTWSLEIIYSKAFGQDSFIDPVVISMASNVSTSPYHLHTAEAPLTVAGGGQNLIDSGIIEPGGIIHVHGYLDSNDIVTGDGSIVRPFVNYSGILYQSRGLGTKTRLPPYWG